MSVDDTPQNKRVRDEEGNVDEKVKNRILTARKNIDDTEMLLYVQAPVEGRADAESQIEGYGMVVRQYIRSILPLLKSEEVIESDYYKDEVELANFEVPPPPGSENWPLLARDHVSVQAVSDTLPPTFDPPEPKPFTLYGLQSILETERVEMEWVVELTRRPTPDGSGVEHLVVDEPLPKFVYDSAVEYADEFLQNIGIGVDIGFQEIDDQDTNPF